MSTPELSELAILEYQLEKAEIQAIALRRFYVLARRDAMAVMVKKRDFDFCCDQGLLNHVDDEGLKTEITREENRKRSEFRMAKEMLFQAEEEASELRKKLRAMRKRGST